MAMSQVPVSVSAPASMQTVVSYVAFGHVPAAPRSCGPLSVYIPENMARIEPPEPYVRPAAPLLIPESEAEPLKPVARVFTWAIGRKKRKRGAR